MKLYTVYGPAEHLDGTIHETREIAEERHGGGLDHFDGTTSE